MRAWTLVGAIALAAVVALLRPRGALQPVSTDPAPPARTLPSQPPAEATAIPSPPPETPEAPEATPSPFEPEASTAPAPASAVEESPTPTQAPTAQPPRRLVAAEAGTSIPVVLQEQLDTQSTAEEQHFAARLAKDLKVGRHVVAVEGSAIEGVVRRVDPPGKVHGRARLDMELTRLQTPRGWVRLTTNIIRKEKSGAGKDGATVGLGALAGAVIGGLVDGRRGAARGAGAGATVGAGAALATRGPNVLMKAGSRLKFRLKLSVLFEVPEEMKHE